ncbi:uncharacterized protein LOC143025449 isoform X2 [Oratosquilla oratoria]|uniref:uncharacterized protein LOC143025449 isoform X2 n=1 Tax=Oratosquilla oratoria TaxID=337810 RepID=UPI003F7635F4
MDPKIILVLLCLASVVACAPSARAAPSPLSLERATHGVARRAAAYGDVLSNLVHRRSRRAAARFGRNFDGPNPNFGTRLCPYPEIPVLCKQFPRFPPSETWFQKVQI